MVTGNFEYKTEGTCATLIRFTLNKSIVQHVEFVGGCPGGLSAVAKLVVGMDIVIASIKLKGVACGSRGSSCIDQLASAFTEQIRLE